MSGIHNTPAHKSMGQRIEMLEQQVASALSDMLEGVEALTDYVDTRLPSLTLDEPTGSEPPPVPPPTTAAPAPTMQPPAVAPPPSAQAASAPHQAAGPVPGSGYWMPFAPPAPPLPPHLSTWSVGGVPPPAQHQSPWQWVPTVNPPVVPAPPAPHPQPATSYQLPPPPAPPASLAPHPYYYFAVQQPPPPPPPPPLPESSFRWSVASVPPWDPAALKASRGVPGPGVYTPARIENMSFNANYTANAEMPGYGKFEREVRANKVTVSVRQARAPPVGVPARAAMAAAPPTSRVKFGGAK